MKTKFLKQPKNRISEYQYADTSKAYDAGYETGKTWRENWTPGGPWCMRGYIVPRYQESADYLKACHDAWKEGWEKGHDEQKINL